MSPSAVSRLWQLEFKGLLSRKLPLRIEVARATSDPTQSFIMVGLNAKLGIVNQSYFGASLSRATLNLRSRTTLGDEMKVIVVGAGITGVSAAEWLRRDGHEVVLIERVSPGDPLQASYGNCGIVGRSSVVPIARIPIRFIDDCLL